MTQNIFLPKKQCEYCIKTRIEMGLLKCFFFIMGKKLCDILQYLSFYNLALFFNVFCQLLFKETFYQAYLSEFCISIKFCVFYTHMVKKSK
jgi:hypothetical protein